ncbi:hypothetical protein O6P43_020027 [Quillaja saponaria]|uniref:Uncharacterized protein n=1 Tax=Quillaja saponaria TaxID=32244 RepID=A0AAD7LK60_QUISA|nr:hypothetical protein O6P43_020027 [Quillaja saponaria]
MVADGVVLPVPTALADKQLESLEQALLMEEAGHEGEGGGGGGGGVDGVYWYGNNNVKANPNPPTMYIPVGPPLTTIDRFSWVQQNQYLSKQQQIHENKEAASVSAGCGVVSYGQAIVVILFTLICSRWRGCNELEI